MTPVSDEIVVRLVDGRAVVEVAPESAWVNPEFLHAVVAGGVHDCDIDGRFLSFGVPGLGLGRVRYQVGPYDRDREAFSVTLLP